MKNGHTNDSIINIDNNNNNNNLRTKRTIDIFY